MKRNRIKYLKMESKKGRINSEKGFALTIVTVFILFSSLLAGIFMNYSVNEIKAAQHQVDASEALYLAETGLQRGLYELKLLEEADNLPTGNYSINNYNLNSLAPQNLNYQGSINMDIEISPNVQGVSYNTSVSVSVGGATKTLHAIIRHQPPAAVFDYIYFINNWGWFYGGGITSEGDVRSNGRFDIKYGPTMNGHVYAADEIDTHGNDVNGLAGTFENGNYPYQHPDSAKLPMPNLDDLTQYEDMAMAQNASISQGGAVVVNGIYGDDPGESGNLVLIGTPTNPVIINGPNVVQGDLIIKGVVHGHGTVYTGRNIYVADDIEYLDGPATPRPVSQDPQDVDDWYDDNKDKDIVGFAARESIILGDYTSSTGGSWYAQNWLFGMGDEDVGQDGILGTNDTYEGDNIFQAAYEDLDGDGVMDDNYNWGDVGPGVALGSFDNLPPGVNNFGDIATNLVNSIEGIFYTNHAFTGRVGYDVEVNGAIISKDEAIIFRDYLDLNYDERVHSRYTSEDPNWLISLGLPSAEDWGIEQWIE